MALRCSAAAFFWLFCPVDRLQLLLACSVAAVGGTTFSDILRAVFRIRLSLLCLSSAILVRYTGSSRCVWGCLGMRSIGRVGGSLAWVSIQPLMSWVTRALVGVGAKRRKEGRRGESLSISLQFNFNTTLICWQCAFSRESSHGLWMDDFQPQLVPIIWMFAKLALTPFASLGRLHLRAGLARARRNSQWIYSSKSEEMNHIHKGRIFVSTAPPIDAYDCTLRFHHAQQKAHLILAHDPQQVSRLLKALASKQRFAEQVEDRRQEGLEKWGGPGELVKYSQAEQMEQGLVAAREFSKQIEMAVETENIVKSNNDRENKLLLKQQEELASFIETSQIRDHLQQFKDAHGHPKVLPLTNNLPTLLKLHKGGVDQLCLLAQTGFDSSKQLFGFLESEKLPYEVLPSPNQLINMLAASGFPADRFAIEYFPTDFSATFQKRRPMKMTIAITLPAQQLLHAVQSLTTVYGKEHFIFIEGDQGQVVFRGPVGELQESVGYAEWEGKEKKTVRLAVAPWLSTFNEGLKEEKSKVSRLYGQAMDDNTHFVRMEFINDELKSLLKRKDRRQVTVDPLVQELLARIPNQQTVAAVLRDVLKVGDKTSGLLVERAKRGMVMDHLGLQEMQGKK